MIEGGILEDDFSNGVFLPWLLLDRDLSGANMLFLFGFVRQQNTYLAVRAWRLELQAHKTTCQCEIQP